MMWSTPEMKKDTAVIESSHHGFPRITDFSGLRKMRQYSLGILENAILGFQQLGLSDDPKHAE